MQFAIRKPGGLHTPPPSLRHIIDIIPCVSALSAQLTHMIKVDEPYISTHSQRKENPVCEDAYNTTHHGIYTLLDFPHLLGLCGALPATWYVSVFMLCGGSFRLKHGQTARRRHPTSHQLYGKCAREAQMPLSSTPRLQWRGLTT